MIMYYFGSIFAIAIAKSSFEKQYIRKKLIYRFCGENIGKQLNTVELKAEYLSETQFIWVFTLRLEQRFSCFDVRN